MQALPQNMNESDFVRMISTQLQSSSKPTTTAADSRVSTSPASITSSKPRSPKRTDSAVQAINNHNLFLQQLFENINRKGMDTSAADGKRKADGLESSCKQKLQKTRHSYSIENLSSKSEDTNSKNSFEEDLNPSTDKLNIEKADQETCEEEKIEGAVDVMEDKEEVASCHSVTEDDKDTNADETEKDPVEGIENQTEAGKEIVESAAVEQRPQETEENIDSGVDEMIKENEDKETESEPEEVVAETDSILEDQDEVKDDQKDDKNFDLQEEKSVANVEGIESDSSDNEEAKKSTVAAV